MEIIGGEPRRRWSLEQKLAIVAATFQPGASVNGVARQAGANPGMVFSWRKELRDQLGFPEQPKMPGFAPVMLAAPEQERVDPASAIIEVDFPGGARARIFGPVEPGLAIAVIGALTRR